MRTRLLAAAGPVFADKGYQAATVRDICLAAHVNVASVNYYFGDKETLYIETVKLARQMRADRFPMPDWPPGTSGSQRLHDFVVTMLSRIMAVDEASWNTRLMLREVLEPTGVCFRLVREYIRPLFETLLDILDELLPKTAPAHLRRQIGFSVIGQCLYYRVADEVVTALVPPEELREHFQSEQLADHITHWCLSALGVLPPWGTARRAVRCPTRRWRRPRFRRRGHAAAEQSHGRPCAAADCRSTRWMHHRPLAKQNFITRLTQASTFTWQRQAHNDRQPPSFCGRCCRSPSWQVAFWHFSRFPKDFAATRHKSPIRCGPRMLKSHP